MNKTAIIIFSRSSKKENIYKKLHTNTKASLRVHTALINKTIQIVEQTGLPFFIIDESKQAGSSFGERFANAFTYIFNKDFDKGIIIGNDCPQLSSAILSDAAKNITVNQLVLGPDRNGGIYLLGISKQLFDAKAIAEIPWQLNGTYNALLNFTCNAADTYILSHLNDLNTIKDYHLIKKISAKGNSFALLLATIICGKKLQDFSFDISIQPFSFFGIKQLRAPPLLYC